MGCFNKRGRGLSDLLQSITLPSGSCFPMAAGVVVHSNPLTVCYMALRLSFKFTHKIGRSFRQKSNGSPCVFISLDHFDLYVPHFGSCSLRHKGIIDFRAKCLVSLFTEAIQCCVAKQKAPGCLMWIVLEGLLAHF